MPKASKSTAEKAEKKPRSKKSKPAAAAVEDSAPPSTNSKPSFLQLLSPPVLASVVPVAPVASSNMTVPIQKFKKPKEIPHSAEGPVRKRKRSKSPEAAKPPVVKKKERNRPILKKLAPADKKRIKEEARSIFGRIEGDSKERPALLERTMEAVVKKAADGLDSILPIANRFLVVTYESTDQRDQALGTLTASPLQSVDGLLELPVLFTAYGEDKETSIVWCIPGAKFDGVVAVREGILAALGTPAPEVQVATVLRWGIFGGCYVAKIGGAKVWSGKKILVGGTERLVSVESGSCFFCKGRHSLVSCTDKGDWSLSDFS